MKVLVIGCGNIGCSAAVGLEKSGHNVSIVDKSYESFSKLPKDFRGKLNTGDALMKDVLVRARAEEVDAVVLTVSDIPNLVIGRLLSEKFGCKIIIAVNTSPKFQKLYQEMGIQEVSPITWSVLRVSQILDTSVNGEAIQ